VRALTPQQRQECTNLIAILRWVQRINGGAVGECPSFQTIARRFGLSGKTVVGQMMARARKQGLIRHVPGSHTRPGMIEVLRLPPEGGAPTPECVPMADTPFVGWLATAKAGERMTYFHGHLAEAREKQALADLGALEDAATAQRAEAAGLVLLTTRREADAFAYIAIKRALCP
jgi:hypothetical protein